MPILTPSYAERMARFKGNLVLQGRNARPHVPLDGTNARTSSQTAYTDLLHGKGDYIRQGPSGPIVEPCCYEDNDMVFLIHTADQTITLPFTLNGDDQITISWGDGSDPETYNATSGPITHTYALDDTDFYIRVSGSATAFGDSGGYQGNDIIISVIQWGVLGLQSLAHAFDGASNLISVPNSVPYTVTLMYGMFRYATSFNADISEWDVSNVTDMHEMFRNAEVFQGGDLTAWNTGNVTDMSRMFKNAYDLSGNLSTWDVGKVTDMYRMFSGTNFFNSDLSLWNTVNVTDMQYMFRDSLIFNSDISAWNTAKVESMGGMFQNAPLFNGNLSDWNVGNVTNMSFMFYDAESYQGGDLTYWNPGKVTNMSYMFHGATVFTGDISTWNVGKVEYMNNMFEYASQFNGDISAWNTAKVISMNSMFAYDLSFNQDLPWDVVNVTDMTTMFRSAQSFTGAGYGTVGNPAGITYWNTRKVQSMTSMFERATVFNTPINADGHEVWNVGIVNSMGRMFLGALAFNQPINNWNTATVGDMNNMFAGYEEDSVSYYTTFNQSINTNSGNWNVSTVQNMSNMFYNNTAFDQELKDWNVSGVTNMQGMFWNASNFNGNNGNVTDWDTSNVTTMYNMFKGASRFLGGGLGILGVNSWDVSNVDNVISMFENAGSAFSTRFLRDLSTWSVKTTTPVDQMFRGTSMPTDNTPPDNFWPNFNRSPPPTNLF